MRVTRPGTPRLPLARLRPVRRSGLARRVGGALLSAQPDHGARFVVYLAVGYLALLAGIELLATLVVPSLALLFYVASLALLLLHAGLAWGRPLRWFPLTISLVPATRLAFLALAGQTPAAHGYLFAAGPLLVALAVARRILLHPSPASGAYPAESVHDSPGGDGQGARRLSRHPLLPGQAGVRSASRPRPAPRDGATLAAARSVAGPEGIEPVAQGGAFALGSPAPPRADAPTSSLPVAGIRRLAGSGPLRLALFYLAALTLAEVLTALVEPWVGLVLHAALLVLLLLHAAVTWGQPAHRLLLSLAFAPMIRLVSLSLPLAGFPMVYWYLITSVPLFIAATIVARLLGLRWKRLGVNLRALPTQLLVALTGLAFGYIEYQILKPQPLATSFSWEGLWLPGLVLLVSTGFVEEFIFRGVMQRSAVVTLGRSGLLYVAVLFAVLHIGYRSVLDVLFVLGVALFFGWVTAETGSILGVTLSHGLTNIVLFLVIPLKFLPAATVLLGASAPAVASMLAWLFLGSVALAALLIGSIWAGRRRRREGRRATR